MRSNSTVCDFFVMGLVVAICCIGCSRPQLVETDSLTHIIRLSTQELWPTIEKERDRQDQLFRKGQTKSLVTEYRRKIIQNPESPIWYFVYGRLLGLLGNPEEAFRLFSLAIAKDPEFVWAYYGLGVHYLKQKSYAGALPYFQKCQTLDPQFVPSLVGMAKVYVESDPSLAVEYLHRASSLRPKDALLQHHLARVLILSHQEQQAIPHLRKASQLAPKNLPILKDLVGILIKHKKLQEAQENIHKMIPLLSSKESKERLEKTLILLQQMSERRDP